MTRHSIERDRSREFNQTPTPSFDELKQACKDAVYLMANEDVFENDHRAAAWALGAGDTLSSLLMFAEGNNYLTSKQARAVRNIVGGMWKWMEPR